MLPSDGLMTGFNVKATLAFYGLNFSKTTHKGKSSHILYALVYS